MRFNPASLLCLQWKCTYGGQSSEKKVKQQLDGTISEHLAARGVEGGKGGGGETILPPVTRQG